MQCILGCQFLRTLLLKQPIDALTKLANDYMSSSHTPLDCTDLRNTLGAPFNTQGEIDPIEFITAVILYNGQLYSSAYQFIAEEEMCKHCGYFVSKPYEVLNLSITICDPPKSIPMNEVIEHFLTWNVSTESNCPKCNQSYYQRTRIVSAQKVIVICLDVIDSVSEIRPNVSLASVPLSTVI